jgi:transposase
MMGRKSKQLCMVMLDMEDLIPRDHLLRKIKAEIDFDFIYEEAESYYSKIGRPSIDPVCLIKMLLVGYLYGVKSERRLEEVVALNIAYRWFCGFDLMDTIPDHSTFSQNRKLRFTDSTIFRQIFNRIVSECIESGLASGETAVSDGSFIPANVSWQSRVEITRLIEKSTVDYLDALDEELKKTEGYVPPYPTITEKKELKSRVYPDCGYIHQGLKKGLGYLTEMTVDTANGIVTGVDCYPANRRESDIVLKHIERQKQDNRLAIKGIIPQGRALHPRLRRSSAAELRGIKPFVSLLTRSCLCEAAVQPRTVAISLRSLIKNLGLDAGYDVGAVHRGLEIMGITGYTSLRYAHNNPMNGAFAYQADNDLFLCKNGNSLAFAKLIFKKGTGYYRLYRIKPGSCGKCSRRDECKANRSIRISASPYYPAYYANRMRHETPAYTQIKKLRNI